MLVKDDAHRALVACRVLENSIIKYLENNYPIHKLAADIQEAERVNGLLLHAIIRIYGLNSRILNQDE